jgi:PAS domain S-box-containing protein
VASLVPAGGRSADPAADRAESDFILDFRAVLDSFADAVVVAGLDNTILYANEATENLLGWCRHELIGKPLWTIIPERLRDAHRSAFARFVRTGRGGLLGIPLVLPALLADGSEMDIELTIGVIDRPDEDRLVLGALRDVRERIELERHNALARHLLQVMAESANLSEATPRILEGVCETLGWDMGVLWTFSHNENILRCEQLWSRPGHFRPAFTAATRSRRLAKGEGLPGQVWAERQSLWLPDVAIASNFVRRPEAIAEGLHAGFAFPVMIEDRLLGVLEFFSHEVREPNDELLDAMSAIGSELARFIERRRREDEVRLEKALLESQSENTLDGILVVAPDGTMLSFNNRFVEMWGIPEEVVASRSDEAALRAVLDKVKDPDGFLERVCYLYDHPDEHSRDEIELVDGRIFDRYSAPLKAPEGGDLGRAWYVRDVTQERMAEQRLAESNMRYRHLAKTLQQSLLPPATVEIPGIEIATLYEPVGKGNLVGGDFYDVFRPREDEWAVVVGDVCGKGVEAAAVTSLVRYTIRAIAMQGSAPEIVLRSTNAAMLMEDTDERFCTAAFVRLRPSQGSCVISVASAGNPLPLVIRGGREIEPLGEVGVPLGLFANPEVRTSESVLYPGDTLVLFTDGVTDSGGDAKALGSQGVSELLLEAAGASAKEIVRRVQALLNRVDVTERRDDCALVALKLRG